MGKWIGIDLDGTLAEYRGFKGPLEIGKPIPRMLDRVREMLYTGVEIKIFTARIDPIGLEKYRFTTGDRFATVEHVTKAIEVWCEHYIGRKLPITDRKDLDTIEIWDDHCVQVKTNTGEFIL